MSPDNSNDYVETELGIYPKEWEIINFGEICNFKGGTQPPRSTFISSFKPGYVRLLQIRDFQNDKNITYISSNYNLRLVNEDDVLIARYGASVGKIFTGKKGAINVALMKIIPNEKFLLKNFIYFYLQTTRIQIYLKNLGGRSAQAGFNKGELNIIKIPLPPLPEQRAIAHVLRTVQEAREKTEAVIEAAKALKKSMMQYLFTYGPVPIDEAEQVPLKETEVGMVPEGWGISRFSEIVEIVKGQIDPREEPYNKMLHIGPENILPETGQIVGMRTAEDIGLISGQFYFTSENVIYSKIRPYLKKVAFPKIEGTCSADMYPLKPKDDRLSPEFLFHYLLSNQFSNDAISFQDRTGIPKINRQQLGLINLPLPKLIIQQKIANSLASIDKKIAAEESRKAALDHLFQSLLHDLMTAKIRLNHISVPVAET
jgi:type I restriction enzyme S subunit